MLVPETIEIESGCITNYLEFSLRHDSTVFSKNDAQKFNFYMIQPSLFSDQSESLPPLLLLNQNGTLMDY